MCRRAAERAVTVCRGDAAALPFADHTFDACRADRVIQHLDDPTTAMRELVRVTRRGGRVVVADPDQETLTIHVPGIPKSFTDRVTQLRRDVGYRNGRLVTELPELFGSLGLTDVTLTAFPLVLTDPDDAFGLRSWPRLWRDRNISTWDDDELAQWEQALGSGDRPGFVYALIYFVVAGTKA
jgi:SAM-dependent methyltransferase